MSFWSDSRRRKFFRVAVLYILAAWVTLQVADLAFPGLGIPPSAIRHVWIAALLGFPIALVAGWLYNVTPRGLVRTVPVDGQDVPVKPLRQADYLILGALMLLSGAILVGLASALFNTRSISMPGRGAAHPLTPLIAVLPFANSSEGQEYAYLPEGISEDILNQLAGVTGLRVVSRSSSFGLAETRVDRDEVARRLQADYLVTGDVGRFGQVVRVTARLFSAGAAEPLWAETYERDRTQVFGIHEAVAASVARTLGIDHPLATEGAHVPDREAYDLYLRARFIAQARTAEALESGVSLIEDALRIDPLFAEGHGFLATLYFLQRQYAAKSPEEESEAFDLAERAAVQALILDENLPAARGILAVRALYRYEWQLAEENFKRTLAVAPNDSRVRRWYSRMLLWLGYIEEALMQAQAAQRLDPLSAASNGNLGLVFALLGEDDEALEYAGIARDLGLESFYTPDIMVYLANGRLDKAATAWTDGLRARGRDAGIVNRVVRATEHPDVLPATLEELEALIPQARPALEPAAALLLLRQYETFLDLVENDGFMDLWSPLARPVRQLPAFRQVVAEAGMLDYWKVRGWPDLCKPADNGFVCD